MIPDFTDDGCLPAGVHLAGVDEIAARFGQEPELRRVQMESLKWLVELARRAGAQRVVIGGSFVTDKWEPNDVDCLLLQGPAFGQDEAADNELRAGLPFIEMVVVGQAEFQLYVEQIYGTDRHGNARGMVEVIL
ncbi:MAG TPA: hypothetical protein VFA18_08225 [Gemmataceae bacterium]|nr:hypothetical protein [Gemmataceae bacterium]